MNYSRKSKAVFLDRDGVIFKEVDHLWKISDAKFFPDIFNALRKIQKFFLIIVITNQAGIAKGLFTTRDYYRLNRWMLKQFHQNGVRISKVYFCPHHPEAIVKKYKKRCNCRKPGGALFKKAARQFNLSLSQSWSIGDKTSDILAGKRAGCKTILVNTGYGGKDSLFKVNPDFQARNLTAATRLIRYNI